MDLDMLSYMVLITGEMDRGAVIVFSKKLTFTISELWARKLASKLLRPDACTASMKEEGGRGTEKKNTKDE